MSSIMPLIASFMSVVHATALKELEHCLGKRVVKVAVNLDLNSICLTFDDGSKLEVAGDEPLEIRYSRTRCKHYDQQ